MRLDQSKQSNLVDYYESSQGSPFRQILRSEQRTRLPSSLIASFTFDKANLVVATQGRQFHGKATCEYPNPAPALSFLSGDLCVICRTAGLEDLAEAHFKTESNTRSVGLVARFDILLSS